MAGHRLVVRGLRRERCAAFGSSFRLFKVRGIDVTADVSWLFIVALVSWTFWARFAVWYDRSAGVARVMALSGAALFFASVVVHELAHALEAQHRGVHVEGITLFVFGGATRSRFDVKRPVDEFALTAVGPYASLVLAASFGLATVGANELELSPVAEVLGNLGWLNLALAVFNLLPGAPLDGGRILRAIVWKLTGDRRKAVVAAANAGRLLGGMIIAIGVLQVFTARGLGGIWLALIGWFLFRAATAERVQSDLETLLSGRSAGQIATGGGTIPASATVAEAIDRWFVSNDSDLFLVDDDGEAVGVVDVDAVTRVDRAQRPSTAVGQVARPIGGMRRVESEAPARELLDAVVEADGPIVLVRDSRATGLVSADRLQRRLLRLQALEHATDSGGSGRFGGAGRTSGSGASR